MSFNGSGTFNVNTSGQPVVAGTTITSAAFNALTADLATGLSTAICKDGQTTVTANIPLNNFKITGLGAGTLTADAARMSQLQSGASQLLTSLTGTDTLTATLLPTLTAYTTGAVYTFVAANTNTTAVTLNIDALGAKAVTRDGSTALVAGDIVAGTTYNVMYDGTRFQLLSRASYTNLSASGNFTLSGGTADGVAYLNGSKRVTTGTAFTYDGNGTLQLGAATVVDAQFTLLAGGVGTGITIKGATDGNGYINTASALYLQTNATNRVAISGAGNVTINAPASGRALTVTGAVEAAGDGSGVGLYVNSSAIRYLTNADNYVDYSFGGATGGLQFRRGASVAPVLTMSNAGNVTINAPASGIALTATAVGTSGAIKAVATTAGSNSFVASPGSATGVAYSFDTNGTVGMYQSAVNNIDFGVLGSSAININSTRNVTINAPASGVALTSYSSGGSVNLRLTRDANNILDFYHGAGVQYIDASAAGSTLAFAIAGTVAARIDSSGNLGLGVTPSAWGAPFGSGTFEFSGGFIAGNASNNAIRYGLNSYYNGTNYIYKTTNPASGYVQASGAHQWFNAPSGTAGNAITFTQAMTLDSSGNLTVPAMYGTTVTTPRNVFIDSTGKMGGISSTRASKTNIADLEDVSWLYDLKPVTFNYRKRDEDGAYLDECEDETQYGMIAEDVEPVAPDLCIYDADGKVAGIHYDRMTAPLLKALQQQRDLINDLTQRLAVLEGKE